MIDSAFSSQLILAQERPFSAFTQGHATDSRMGPAMDLPGSIDSVVPGPSDGLPSGPHTASLETDIHGQGNEILWHHGEAPDRAPARPQQSSRRPSSSSVLTSQRRWYPSLCQSRRKSGIVPDLPQMSNTLASAPTDQRVHPVAPGDDSPRTLGGVNRIASFLLSLAALVSGRDFCLSEAQISEQANVSPNDPHDGGTAGVQRCVLPAVGARHPGHVQQFSGSEPSLSAHGRTIGRRVDLGDDAGTKSVKVNVSTALCCIVLYRRYCTVLYCAVLYCIVPSVLYCTVPSLL
jgi:hypothetical protein